tara:strand:+ start:147 stop:683 length:537 start_codon:yes stop_codon:yes gene_type:complete
MAYYIYIERNQPIMTNFNHAQIAKNTVAQIEEVMINGDFTKNDANAVRIAITHWFLKFNRDGIKDDFRQEDTVDLYTAAIEHTTFFGKTLMGVEGGEVGMAKAVKLRKAVLTLVAQELEEGTPADFDLVVRQIVQQQMLNMYRQINRDAGEEAASLVIAMNNAVTDAINAELAVANAA